MGDRFQEQMRQQQERDRQREREQKRREEEQRQAAQRQNEFADRMRQAGSAAQVRHDAFHQDIQKKMRRDLTEPRPRPPQQDVTWGEVGRPPAAPRRKRWPWNR